MKIVKFNEYGDYKNIYIDDVEIPIVNSDSVLVKVHASSINMLDVRVLSGNPSMIRDILGNPKPTHNSLGSDISGVVEQVGENVTDFKVGDEVYGQLAMNQDGGFAEYANVPTKQLTQKPLSVSHSEASSVPMAGVTALQGLRKLDISDRTNLLIYGASGGVGTFAIQIAKNLGAHVTAVCSTRNYQNAVDSNANVVIDYKKDNWVDPNIKYDAIFAVNGYNPLQIYLDSLIDNGKVLIVGHNEKLAEEKLQCASQMKKTGKEVLGMLAQINKNDYDILSEMLKTNKLRPYVDKEFSLEHTQEAFKHFMSGKTIGKTSIKIVND